VGPIEFSHLDNDHFPAAEWRQKIVETLQKSLNLPENLCIHGFNVNVKGKTLKRASTIVKHSKFMRNMIINPIYPPEPDLTQAVIAEKPEEDEE
jgi:hypothetical protein